MSSFDFGAFFGRLQDMKRLQIPADEVSWIEKHRPTDRTYDTLLYLGCNILRTPHIAKQVVAVFDHLGIDFAAVGGVQFCCGIVRDRFDGALKGSKTSERSVRRMEDYQPKRVVMWCPSCNVHFKDVVTGRDSRKLDFAIVHTPELLAGMAAKGELPWKQEVPCQVYLHTHVGREDHEEGQRRARSDRESVAALLATIPGVELAGEVQGPPELDYDCGAAGLRLPAERTQEIRSELMQPLTRENAADRPHLVVTISHACHREWCQMADERWQIRNYISIVAEALGLGTEDDRLGSFKNSRDLEGILDQTENAWSSHGLSREEARELAAKYFAGGEMAP